MNFHKALTVARHRLPPGHIVILKNRQEIPDWFSGGSRKAEAGVASLGSYEEASSSAKQSGSRKTEAAPGQTIGVATKAPPPPPKPPVLPETVNLSAELPAPPPSDH